jgi:hypothetical protein
LDYFLSLFRRCFSDRLSQFADWITDETQLAFALPNAPIREDVVRWFKVRA